MKKWTVILLYPDYMAENYGQKTFMTSVDAETPEAAVAAARKEVSESEDTELQDPEDMFVIAVIEGEHQDHNPER